MKTIHLIIILSLCTCQVFSQDTIQAESTIHAVTVYKEGAQIKRKASVLIDKGKTTIILKDLSSKLDKNTIRVKSEDGITVLSVIHTFNFLNQEKSNKQITLLKEEQEQILDTIGLYKKFLVVLKDEKQLLQTNRSIGGAQTGVDIENLKATAEFYRNRMKEIELQILDYTNRIKELNLRIIQIARQLNELNAQKDFTVSDVIVVLKSEKKQKADINFEYFVSEAGWFPYYDIRVKDVNNPVKIFYKAKIFQNTNVDWENVKLTLSTGNPSVSGFKPKLSTYYLTQNNFYKSKSRITDTGYYGYVKGKITDDYGEALPGVTVIIKGTDMATITDLNGNYSINAPYGSELVYRYIGFEDYEQKVVSSGMNIMLSSDTDIEEVVVTALGMSREEKALGYSVQDVNINGFSGGAAGVSSGITIRGSSSLYGNKSKVNNLIPMNIKKYETNREFIIDIPYTIRSDKKEYDVSMTEFELASDYTHYTVPKLSEKVYLTSLMTGWQEMGMLNGDANVFFKETFTGKTYLDLETLSDTITLSLGVDNDVFVEREQIKEYKSRKTLGTNIKESRAWKISVKNLKAYPIELIIEDQLPVSKNNKIKVEKEDISGAVEEEDTGLLEWKIDLEPNISKEFIIKYSVKYPDYLKIIVD
jgi:hypothetical protein